MVHCHIIHTIGQIFGYINHSPRILNFLNAILGWIVYPVYKSIGWSN